MIFDWNDSEIGWGLREKTLTRFVHFFLDDIYFVFHSYIFCKGNQIFDL